MRALNLYEKESMVLERVSRIFLGDEAAPLAPPVHGLLNIAFCQKNTLLWTVSLWPKLYLGRNILPLEFPLKFSLVKEIAVSLSKLGGDVNVGTKPGASLHTRVEDDFTFL